MDGAIYFFLVNLIAGDAGPDGPLFSDCLTFQALVANNAGDAGPRWAIFFRRASDFSGWAAGAGNASLYFPGIVPSPRMYGTIAGGG